MNKFSAMIRRKIHKNRLKNAFNYGQIYYKTQRNGKNFYQFPRILDIRQREDRTVFVFRLPHAVDPLELRKKSYVFKSIFGENIDFSGTASTPMVLTIHHTLQNGSYSYDYEEFKEVMKKCKLPIIAGKDINGNYLCYDMTEHPHLLIAGETGSGKSVMVRSIVTSLIQHFQLGGLQLHLCDLKRSEFHLFRNVNIVEAVLTKKSEVAKCVAWFHKQLEKRGDLLDQYELSHIDDYNKLEGVKKQQYLVLCIDEFSMLRDLDDTIEQLIDISALGRALGIYLILSTQRPDRNIVDGLMKANLTIRYAFRHADKVNSRITLGEGAKADASDIDEEDKGKFYMRFSNCPLLQSPFLPIDDMEFEDGVKVLGAKSILAPFKTKVKMNGDIIEYEGEVTESDTEPKGVDLYLTELLEDTNEDFAPVIEED